MTRYNHQRQQARRRMELRRPKLSWLRQTKRSIINSLTSFSTDLASESWLNSSKTSSTDFMLIDREPSSNQISKNGNCMSNLVDLLLPLKRTWTSWWKTLSLTSSAKKSSMESTQQVVIYSVMSSNNKSSTVWWWSFSLTVTAKETNSSLRLKLVLVHSKMPQSISPLSETQCTNTARRLKTDISHSPSNPSCLPHSLFLMKVRVSFRISLTIKMIKGSSTDFWVILVLWRIKVFKP